MKSQDCLWRTFTAKAYELAEMAHEGQLYGDDYYMSHLRDVMYEVAQHNQGNTNLAKLICVAWLHDIIEDTWVDKQYLLERFPEAIVDAVVAISKVEGESYEDYIGRVRANPLAHEVKIWDTYCNLRASMESRNHRWMVKYSKQLGLLVE